jgi:hypothetical protein
MNITLSVRAEPCSEDRSLLRTDGIAVEGGEIAALMATVEVILDRLPSARTTVRQAIVGVLGGEEKVV